MATFDKIGEYLKAEPFRPFRIKMASGQIYEIRHPEMILVGRNLVRVYGGSNGAEETPAEWHDVSMMLMETIEPLAAATKPAT
jgi:hypothetical protein